MYMNMCCISKSLMDWELDLSPHDVVMIIEIECVLILQLKI